MKKEQGKEGRANGDKISLVRSSGGEGMLEAPRKGREVEEGS